MSKSDESSPARNSLEREWVESLAHCTNLSTFLRKKVSQASTRVFVRIGRASRVVSVLAAYDAVFGSRKFKVIVLEWEEYIRRQKSDRSIQHTIPREMANKAVAALDEVSSWWTGIGANGVSMATAAEILKKTPEKNEKDESIVNEVVLTADSMVDTRLELLQVYRRGVTRQFYDRKLHRLTLWVEEEHLATVSEEFTFDESVFIILEHDVSQKYVSSGS